MHILLKSAFYLTEMIRKIEGYRGSLIKIFEFIMVLTLGNHSWDLLNIPKMWYTY